LVRDLRHWHFRRLGEEIVNRKKELIIRGDDNIYPLEIEEALLSSESTGDEGGRRARSEAWSALLRLRCRAAR
jgi:hypothetical protein